MFRWYQNAAKCYVYLSDVSIGPVKNNLSSQWTWKPAFQRSRWFTRGWTLQELIAPISVEFFSGEGERLGDKNLLVQEIHEITGIAVRALQGSPLSQFSVSERLSWATGRVTKREEDAAYSLLGIFDVHMPLIYGEGRKKAFIRLQKEIKESLNHEWPILPRSARTEDDSQTRESSSNSGPVFHHFSSLIPTSYTNQRLPMSAGFGFSAGDFNATLNLIGEVVKALNDRKGAVPGYKELIRELYTLEDALLRVKCLRLEEEQQVKLVALREAAGQCQGTIDDFWKNYVKKYEASLQSNNSSCGALARLKDRYAKAKRGVFKKGDLAKFKANIASHTAFINIVLLVIQM